MANRYVYSGAGGGGTGADWANAHTTIAAAITAGAAGDVYFVASDHAESAASAKTLTFKGTAASPDMCLSVNRAGSVPPVAADLLAGASVTTTGTNAITLSGTVYGFGLAFNSGTGAGDASITLPGASNGVQVWNACAFNIVATGASSRIAMANSNNTRLRLVNCTVSFGATGQSITCGSGVAEIVSKPGSAFVTGATIPTTLIVAGGSPGARIGFSGLDLSSLGSGSTLLAGTPSIPTPVSFVNCKLNGSVTVAATPSGPNVGGAQLIGCGSTGNVARNEWHQYQGTLTTETTVVRTGGASDGTTPYSWKVVSNANNERNFPFECFEGVIWNTTLSAITLTINTVTDNVTLTDAEAWVEVEYLASSATPVATLVSDGAATVLTTPANQPTNSETWTTTGLTTPVKQGLAVTFTPGMVGPIRWRVKIAKASTTVYIDPKPVIS